MQYTSYIHTIIYCKDSRVSYYYTLGITDKAYKLTNQQNLLIVILIKTIIKFVNCNLLPICQKHTVRVLYTLCTHWTIFVALHRSPYEIMVTLYRPL